MSANADNMKRLRADFRYHRYLCPAILTLLEGKNPRSSAASESKNLFHQHPSKAAFTGSLARPSATFPPARPVPCLPQEGTFCSKTSNDPFTSAYKMMLGCLSLPSRLLACRACQG